MRRPFPTSLSPVCLTATLAALALSAVAVQPDETRPNIIFIVADDLGYADLSGYGRKDYATPVLDRLATEGVRFSQAYAAAPVCTPARVAFMTGRYPARTLVGLFEPLTGEGDETVGLPSDHPTISSLLQARGYETALVGKWHLGVQPEHHPNRHGFAHFFGILPGAADYISHVDPHGQSALLQNEQSIERDGYLTDLLTAQAVAFIAGQHEKPFFLSIQYTAPHWPWQRPGDPPYTARSGPAAVVTSTAAQAEGMASTPGAAAAWRRGGSASTYAEMVTRLDRGVGEILEAVAREGHADNTLVIFTSDNGGERFSDMGPLSGHKMQLREGGIRVPAIVRWPGVLPQGQQTNQVTVTMDWTATILAAASTSTHPDYPLDGIDLLPICRGDTPVQPRTLAWRTFQRGQSMALRHGDWKYLREGETEYLFDLSRDPGETRDWKAEQSQRFEDLKAHLRRWESQVLSPVPAPEVSLGS